VWAEEDGEEVIVPWIAVVVSSMSGDLPPSLPHGEALFCITNKFVALPPPPPPPNPPPSLHALPPAFIVAGGWCWRREETGSRRRERASRCP
jgi:hypothetical protein